MSVLLHIFINLISSHCNGSNRKVNEKTLKGKEGNGLFNDTLNTFYLRLYDAKLMVKDHSDSKIGNPLLLLQRLSFSISSKDSFTCTIPQTG